MTPETLDQWKNAFVWTCLIFAAGHMIHGFIIAGTRRRVAKLEGQDPDHAGSVTHAISTARQLQYRTDQLAKVQATLNRIETLCVTAEALPEHLGIKPAALREAIDGQKPPVKPVRRDPQSGLIMNQKQYDVAHGFTNNPHVPRPAASTPPTPDPVKVKQKPAKHAADPETTAQLDQARRDLETARARLSRVAELIGEWSRYGAGGMSYKRAADSLMDALLLEGEEDTEPPNPIINLGNIRP